MTQIASITFYLALLCLALAGCAHSPDTTVSNQQANEKLRVDTEKARELQRSANVVVDYEWSDRIRVYVPGQTLSISATDETLATVLASATPKRELVVVILGPPVRHALPEPQLRTKVDSIEAVVRGQGFTRVVFQLASAFGYPIYHE